MSGEQVEISLASPGGATLLTSKPGSPKRWITVFRSRGHVRRPAGTHRVRRECVAVTTAPPWRRKVDDAARCAGSTRGAPTRRVAERGVCRLGTSGKKRRRIAKRRARTRLRRFCEIATPSSGTVVATQAWQRTSARWPKASATKLSYRAGANTPPRVRLSAHAN